MLTKNVPASPFEIQHKHGDDYATWYIRKKADELVDHFGVRESDREDIEQDLALDLVQRWPKYDPERGKPNTFIARVVRNKVSTIIRYRRTEQQLFEEVGHVPIDDTIEDEVANCRRTDLPKRIDQEYVDLAVDVEAALAGLPDDLREVCEALKTKSVSAVAADLEIPVNTLRHRLKPILEHFEDAALRDYL